MEVDGLRSTVMPQPSFTWFSGSSPTVTLTFNYMSQNLIISTPMNPNTSVTNTGWNSFHCFLRNGVHKVSGTHRHTHRLIQKLTHGRTYLKTQLATSLFGLAFCSVQNSDWVKV